MNSTQKQLISLISNALFGCATNVALTNDILQEARLQAVSSLISRSERSVFANNIRVDYAHAELTNVLCDIPFVTIKGYASAMFYPNPFYRTMGDVDFYVEPQNFDIASNALTRAGFFKTDSDHDRHDTFIKNGIVFELHSEIKGIPNGYDGIKTKSPNAERIVRGYLSDVISTATTVNTQFGDIYIPDYFHHGMIMLLHIAGHIVNGGGIGLRHLCDWAVYVNSVDISEYKDKFCDMGLWTFACQLTQVCEKYLGMEKKNWSGNHNAAFLEDLIEDILDSGNFGRKDIYRTVFNKFSSNSFIELAKNRFPITKKHPILLPIVIIYWCFWHLFQFFKAKKTFIKPKDILAGKDRIKIYKQFQLFESED